ncbi:hypothetical protein SPRG_14899 [Saprolegnia parasitica CBS 223.65]|uniref:DEAD/DEAH box helicase n=1 Tax=Saprolegnia parasitica (strain CBS 223.65) TaxID=695850 RepID=A0A067BN00_SAPPC|nr:hypothetical protein SPRG_14899 [Saprolegnia parasitica CBS 223.65]KDO19869.1 hypothetical protein SPRG_14899 [Saprolegnia parasitica CBS 223.65]|eukprot:XP_012209426.1 hypothetical protein SPRG_14899 [Saprolegnia parasitica CBS 223.65]
MQVLPLGLAGHDVLLSAPTGTGKTVAFLLPLLARAMAARFEINGVLGLILAPVRELCIQIEAQIKDLVQGIPKMRTALLVGGMPLPNQLHRLAQGPQVLIGTPGRLLAIHTDHGLMLQDVRTCVLDEADRLCDDEFRDATTTLLSLLPVHRQLFFASATMTPAAEAIARTLAPDVLRVAHTFSSGPSADIPRHVTQHVQYVANAHKTKRLFELLRRKPSDDPLHATLVFVASQEGADVLVKSIYKACNVPALSIHGGKSQAARLQAMEAFVAGTASILVATYVLGRGMDLLSVDDVVIFDLPPTVDEYVHLVGRAGRSGDPGRATVFVNEENARLFPALTSSVWATVRDLPTQVTDAIVSERKRKREPIEALCQRAHDAADHWRDWTSTKRKRDDGDLALGQPRQRIND